MSNYNIYSLLSDYSERLSFIHSVQRLLLIENGFEEIGTLCGVIY